MSNEQQGRRISFRLSPYQARMLWKLRHADIPEGGQPRTTTAVFIKALEILSAAHECAAAAWDRKPDDSLFDTVSEE